ncbi:MAG TPA: xanthine dehydrogenase family protein molybdopterin-binding subunit [Stellaceae bacterium]|jgi:carbon-monoxide dehydrogenase large subunit|nr:xanthine dehydrogenase family protein molybdopterin-binding subunit [Stellaceae bacterium]
MRWVGRRLPRYEDPVLLHGNGRYVADLARGARAMRFVRSPVARGTIRAVKIPPGALVVTAADLGAVKPLCPRLLRPDFVPIAQPILAAGRVRYVGEPIAAVIADSAAEAEDLAELVEVEIDQETPVVTFDQALAVGAPPVHDNARNNTIIDTGLDTGDVASAFTAADRIVEFAFVSHRQSAMPLEARGALAAFDPATGRVTLSVSAQSPHLLRTGIADALGMPESELRVIAPDVGGGFGQKVPLIPEHIVAVWAARRFRGTVAWIEDRLENLTASFHARDQLLALRGAFAADGKLLALDADILCNIGAYSNAPITGALEPLMAMSELPGPYALPAYRVRSRGIITNTCPMAPYRGVSRPVITTAMERLMDTAAARLGLDPLEVRRRNLIKSFPHTSPTGIVQDAGSYREAMEVAAARADIPGFRVRQQAARAEGRYLGIGFSVFAERTGYGTPTFAARKMEITPGFERVELAMDPSGFVEARIGASPHGQGLKTTLAQLLADEIGIAPDRIRVIAGDTDRTPYGFGTFASRSAVIAGGACKLAATKLRERLKEVAAQTLEAAASDIEIDDGRATVRGTDLGVGVPQLARAAYHESHRFPTIIETGLSAVATYDPDGTFSNACHVAIVEVDVATGKVAIERFVIVEDAGILINPTIVEGQIHGGVAQGIANALYEQVIYDEGGNILTGSLADYLVPTMAEIPDLEIHHLETITDASITGVKGVGEGGAIGAPGAVLNAVVDALSPFGIEIFEMPITPQRILQLLQERPSPPQ